MIHGTGKLRRWPISCAWFLSVLIVINGCSSFVPPSLPSLPSLGPPTEDEEVRISREFRREAKKEFKFVNDPEVERYVDRIGQRILSAMGPHSFDYRFFGARLSTKCFCRSRWNYLHVQRAYRKGEKHRRNSRRA